MSSLFTQFRKGFSREGYSQPLIIAIGVVGSLLLGWQVYRTNLLRSRAEFYRYAETRQILVRSALEGTLESVESIRGLVSIEPSLSSKTFHQLAATLLTRHPTIGALYWAPFVPQSDRAVRETAVQRATSSAFQFLEPGPEGEFHPARERTEYWPICYSESTGGFPSYLGWDLSSGSLQPALAAARNAGATVISAKLKFAAEGGPIEAIAIVSPVFSPADARSPKSARPLGYLVGVCRPETLLGESWKIFPSSFTEALFLDATPGADEAFLFFRGTESEVPADIAPTSSMMRADWHIETPYPIGGRTWKMLYRPRPGWVAQQKSPVPFVLIGGGLLITGLVVASLRSSTRRAASVANEVEQRTAELIAIKNELEEDIRRREYTERQLIESQQQLQALMENSPSAIYVKDISGRYLAVNRRFAELHGRDREHFIGRTDQDVFPPEMANRTRQSDARVTQHGHTVELEDSVVTAAGSQTSLVHKFPLTDSIGQIHGLCGIATDISERKRAEAELRESRRQIESLLGQLPGMAFRYVNDGKLTPVYISRGAVTLTGYNAREFLEEQVKLDEIIHPEDRHRVRTAIATAVKKRRSFEVEYRMIHRSGRTKWVLERGQGVHDEEGHLLSIEGLAIDVTQRKDAESEKLLIERRMLEGQKLESIGVLAGGIAHDFNNLLTGIIGNANLASLELPIGSRVHQNLKQIETASQRAAELCQQMLAYAGKGRYIVQRVELGPLIENTVSLLRASISKRASLHFDLHRGLAPVLADPTQVRQIVMNLVINASEALGEKDGDITLSTSLVQPDSDYFAGAILTPPEIGMDFVQLHVRDTGCGMSADTIAKIFDPFFTTKFAGRGLGLAAVLGIIRSHRGGLKVVSEPGSGSTFILLFPAAPAATEAAPTRRALPANTSHEGNALLIDDEEHVLNVTAGMLRACGLKTDVAHDGYEGADLFRANPDKYDIVLLDMTMPRLSGEETLVLLREVKPDVRVLFISGYNRREVVDAMTGSGMLAFIQKPFNLDTLREQLEVMLG